MQKRKTSFDLISDKRLLSEESLQIYIDSGRNMAREIGKMSGCVRHIGRRVLYDRVVLDKYLDGLTESERIELGLS